MTIDRPSASHLGGAFSRPPATLRDSRLFACALTATGLLLCLLGQSSETNAHELVVQLVWTGVWLLTIEFVYQAIRVRTISRVASEGRGAGRPSGSLRAGLLLIVLVAAIVPLSIVFEVLAQWAANRVLYDPGLSDPTYVGWLRGWIDTRSQSRLIALSQEPLSAFTRRVLGWHDERHPFAVVVCSSMVGDLVWAPVAMSLGLGGLRTTAPVLARAFRVAALQAATAPFASLAFFELTGGRGVNAWTPLFGALLGSFDTGSQVPMWVRVFGVAIFYLLPVAILGWRSCAERDSAAIGSATPDGPAPASGAARIDRLSVARSPALLPAPFHLLPSHVLPLIAAVLLGVWWLHLSMGPFGHGSQLLWLLVWLLYLQAIAVALRRLAHGRRSRSPLPTGGRWQVVREWVQAIGIAGPLAIAGLVVQSGAQWLTAVYLLDPSSIDLQFFGVILGQVRPLGAGMVLPPLAISSALFGNVLWMALLAVVASQTARRRPDAPWASGVRLAALQAATVPTALGAFMVLSIVTRTDTQPGVPRFDVWSVWTYLTRQALGAPFLGEQVPPWLAPATVAVMAGAPIVVGMLVAKPGDAGGRHGLTAGPAARRPATAVALSEVS